MTDGGRVEMKAIMYHYVRPAPEQLPYFRYLHIDDFARQLDWFARHDRFLSREEFDVARETGEVRDGVVLTFDDGLADHYTYILPLLVERGLFGIFYVCTAPLERRKLLDVHRIHLLLGRLGGEVALRRLSECLDGAMLSDTHVKDFREATYSSQDNDHATTAFKRILNYLISYEHRERVLDQLFAQEFGHEGLAQDFYLSAAQIREMDRLGMVMGSHGVNHYVFSKLPVESQREEITGSFASLARLLGKPVTTFCYPYGGRHTFTEETVSLLEQAGCLYSFAVNPRAVTSADLTGNRQALPRYDCNLFPHGKASLGTARAQLAV
jgi:peptidoglycan/xylan/chitin deacetylase (PgdA/CDA1 family)